MRYHILNKKSQEPGTQGIVVMVLLLLSLVALFTFLAIIFLPSIFDESICRASVEKNKNMHLIRGMDISKEINCRTNELTIAGDDEQQMKRILANEMRDCWYQYGEGKWNLFSGEGSFCAICSIVDFETEKPLTGFSKYLMDTTLPNKDITYADYLQGYSTKQTEKIKSAMTPEQIKAFEKETLDTTKKYAIVFSYVRGQDQMEEYARHVTMQTESGKYSAYASVAVGGATAVAVTFTFIALGSNPVGWAVIGATVTAVALTEFATTFLRETKVEHISFIVLEEYSAESLETIGCQELPISQKKANT